MASREMTVFQKALLDSVLMEYQDIPDEQEMKDRFSQRFHLWADGFVKKQNPHRVHLRRALRAALIAAILMALLAGAAMAIPVVREAVIDYFLHARIEANGILFDPQVVATAPDTIETVYTVKLIPEGYDLTMDVRHPRKTMLCWEHTLGHSISFSQYSIGDRAGDSQWIGVGNPDAPRKQVLIGDYIMEVIDQGEVYSFVWTDNEYFFLLHIPAEIDWNTMVKIVESVGPVT